MDKTIPRLCSNHSMKLHSQSGVQMHFLVSFSAAVKQLDSCPCNAGLEFRLKVLSWYRSTKHPKDSHSSHNPNHKRVQCLDHLLSHQVVMQPPSHFHLQRFCSQLQSVLINHHYYWLLVLQLHLLSCNPQCLEEHKTLSLQYF